MTFCSSTDLAIALAIKAGTLIVEEREGRFGPFIYIGDDRGIIETQDTRKDADARIRDIRKVIS